MSRTTRRVTWGAVLLVVAALVAGCTTTTIEDKSSSGPSTSFAAHYPNTSAGLQASITDHMAAVGPDLNQWAPSHREAKCAAIKIVARLKVNRLLDLGYQADKGSLSLPYTDDERTSLTNILVGCINFAKGVLSLITSYQKLAVAPAECVTDGLARRGLTTEFAAAYLVGGQPDPFAHNGQLGSGLGALLAQCLTPATDLVPGSPVYRFPSELNTTTTTTDPLAPRTTTTTTAPPTSTSAPS